MNKTAQDQITSHYYNLGVQIALEKTAGIGSIAARTGGGILGAAALSGPGLQAGKYLGGLKSIMPHAEQLKSVGLEKVLQTNPGLEEAILAAQGTGGSIGLLTALGLGGLGGQHVAKKLIR